MTLAQAEVKTEIQLCRPAGSTMVLTFCSHCPQISVQLLCSLLRTLMVTKLSYLPETNVYNKINGAVDSWWTVLRYTLSRKVRCCPLAVYTLLNTVGIKSMMVILGSNASNKSFWRITLLKMKHSKLASLPPNVWEKFQGIWKTKRPKGTYYMSEGTHQ